MNWTIYLFAACFACFALWVSPATAKENIPSAETEVRIMTSAYSFMCKTNIETAVKKLNGVNEAFLELSNKTLTVKYNPLKTTQEKIADVVANLGYKAEIIKEAMDVNSELGYKASFKRIMSDTSVFELSPKDLEIAR